MDRVFEVAAGIDVHRDTVVVSVRRQFRKRVEDVETRTFETFHDGLVAMTLWLEQQRIEVVGLESTGVYWQPVVQAIQKRLPSVTVWLVNPTQVKKVAGRKSDVSDSQWLSKLVMYGLVSPSFVPSLYLQELRKLTRYRTKLTADCARVKNRIIKELERNGLKLATVCSDVLGKTGRALLDAMLAGKVLDEADIEERAYGSLRNCVPDLARALKDPISPCTAIILRQMLRRLDDIKDDIANLESEIRKLLQPIADDVARLDQIPGIDEIAAAAIVAETGPDMSVFPSAKHLASWGGLSPGSEESAGKAKQAPTRKGNKYLRTILVQAALSAKKTKGSFWQNKGRRLARLGPKKAAVALARSLASVVFHILRDRCDYRDPVTIPPPPARVKARLVALTDQIRRLGFDINITPRPVTLAPVS
jgi:transposase